MSIIEQEEQDISSSSVTIRKKHELVDIARVLLLLATMWEKTENGRLEVAEKIDGAGYNIIHTRMFSPNEDGEGFEERLQEFNSIAQTLKGLLERRQEVKVTFFDA